MPFDPAIPATNAELTSAMLRGQFQGLKAIIDAIAQILAAQIDGVTTLNPGEAATATVSVSGDTLHFIFAIPRGDEGLPGQPGIDGAVGPPFAQAIVDAVNTLNPGDNATVGVGFDGTNVHLTFGIPRGDIGPQGIDGGQGLQGIPGTDGAPGEVTNAALAAAIEGTSNNTNAVATLDTAPTDPPSFADYEALRSKLNEMILNGRR